jgi:hypothetical protein
LVFKSKEQPEESAQGEQIWVVRSGVDTRQPSDLQEVARRLSLHEQQGRNPDEDLDRSLGADACHEITHIRYLGIGGWKRKPFNFTSNEMMRRGAIHLRRTGGRDREISRTREFAG